MAGGGARERDFGRGEWRCPRGFFRKLGEVRFKAKGYMRGSLPHSDFQRPSFSSPLTRLAKLREVDSCSLTILGGLGYLQGLRIPKQVQLQSASPPIPSSSLVVLLTSPSTAPSQTLVLNTFKSICRGCKSLRQAPPTNIRRPLPS